MNQNASAELLLRLVQEKHTAVKNSFADLFAKLTSENKQEKIKSAQVLYDDSKILLSILSKQDQPAWLIAIKDQTARFISHPNNSNANQVLLNVLINHSKALKNHKWIFTEGSNGFSYNFDEIYERFKSESRLPDLFDTMISTLEKMIETGEIDSIKTLDSLKKLLSMLKHNKSGSYFSMMASWEFLGGFIKNVVWESLDDIPGVKQLKKAFEKTICEVDIELEEIHKEIAGEMKSKFGTVVHSLTYKRNDRLTIEHKAD